MQCKTKCNTQQKKTNLLEDNGIETQVNNVNSTNSAIDLNDFPVLGQTLSTLRTVNKKEVTTSFQSWIPIVNSQTDQNLNNFPKLQSINQKSRKPEEKLEKNSNNESRLSGLYNIESTESEQQNKCLLVQNKTVASHNVQLLRNPNKKKRADPISINLEDILEISRVQKKNKTSKGKSKFIRRKTVEHLSGNILDSSNPKRNKGKHREIEKKKISNLKVTIIKERILKQKQREKTLNIQSSEECDNLLENLDFKGEIQKYLINLTNQKTEHRNKKVQNTVSKVQDTIEEGRTNKYPDKLIKGSLNQDKAESSKLRPIQFSSKLREYCDNVVTLPLNAAVSDLIVELVILQDRAFLRDPIKGRARRRHVSGLNEVKKYLNMKKVKMIIIAPNLEKLQMAGSLYDLIKEIKEIANTQGVPYAFALDRRKLGRCTKKNVPVSAFAILNYEGLESRFECVLQHLEEARMQFNKRMSMFEEKDDELKKINMKVTSSLLSDFNDKLIVN